eukprot:7670636-Alexandrium_andersonii.AAC.1
MQQHHTQAEVWCGLAVRTLEAVKVQDITTAKRQASSHRRHGRGRRSNMLMLRSLRTANATQHSGCYSIPGHAATTPCAD